MYFDSHAHYDDERFDEDRDVLLSSMPHKQVDFIVNAAANRNSCYKGIELARKYPFIYCSIGIHPHEVKDLPEDIIEELRTLALKDKVVAIGEIGLDYYYDFSPREEQKKWFIKQLDLAYELNLPSIIHSRDASKETFDIICESGIKEGVIHCYSGSAQLALEYVKKGFYIGIGGALTFKNAKKTIEVVKEIPLESILIETDAPYLAPVPCRGKRNDSSYLKYVVEKIAEIKEMDSLSVSYATCQNAKKLFRI